MRRDAPHTWVTNMSVNIDKGSALENLSLTPLIDIVFLLLIFFLVAARFSEEEQEMDVAIPEASEAKPLTTAPDATCININAQGEYIIEGKTISLDQLYPVLRAVWVNNPGRASVIIRADGRCQFDPIIAAMNACVKADIRDYKVAARDGDG